MNLYNENDLKELEHQTKIDIFFLILLIFFLFISTTILLLISDYYTKNTYKIIVGFLDTILVISIYFFLSYRILRRKKIIKHMSMIINDSEKNVKGKIIGIDKKPITLLDSNSVYQVFVLGQNNTKKIFYYNKLFGEPSLEINQTYEFGIAFLYIKRYCAFEVEKHENK